MAVAPEDIQATFDSNARKYRLCFGYCCHVRTCARIIGYIEAAMITIIFISSLIGYAHHQAIGTRVKYEPPPRKHPETSSSNWRWNETNQNETDPETEHWEGLNPEVQFAVCTFFFIVIWMAVILLLCGISKIKPKCLLPHLFLQGLSILYTLVMIVVYAVQREKWATLTLPPKPALVIYTLACVVAIYFFICVCRCYSYLKANRRASPVCRLQKLQGVEEGGAGSPT